MGKEDEVRTLEALLTSAPFPMTKAEIIHYAKVSKASETFLNLLGRLPARCYRSKRELVNEYFLKSMACSNRPEHKLEIRALLSIEPPNAYIQV